MRRSHPLLLLAICGILIAVGVSYHFQRRAQQSIAPPTPPVLSPDLHAAASDWRWSHTVEGRPVVEVRAKSFRQLRESSRLDLTDVELRLYNKEGNTYDQVRSAQAEFDTSRGVLYSDGEVEITMGVPAQGSAPGRLVYIRTSGVTFESKTGKASTDRPATFALDHASGRALGASYDPTIRELHLRSKAEVTWQGRGPKSIPMTVQAGEMVYRERDSVILLSPWSRLTRENMVLEAGQAIIVLEDGSIGRVEASSAHGTDNYPGRKLEYGAERLRINFSETGEVEKVIGERHARLTSISQSSSTTVTADRLDLDFEEVSGEGRLRKALALGKSIVEEKPLPSKSGPLPETRILRSDAIMLKMQPNGREIESAETTSPGTVEFLPNRPGQRRRTVTGKRMWFNYGGDNQIRSFVAVNVSTHTESLPSGGQSPARIASTSSDGLRAEFDPATGQLSSLEQFGDFRYEEGDLKASAERAVFDSRRRLITLESSARLWDLQGSVSADRIVLDQRTDDVSAQGHVASTRSPDRKANSMALLGADSPVQATADRMTSNRRNRLIHYEGNALLWQGGNRIQGEWIEIDREERQLSAGQNVITQLMEAPEQNGGGIRQRDGSGSGRTPVFTVIQAQKFSYREDSHVAQYEGSVRLTRPNLEVRALKLRAHLLEQGGRTELEKAYADGAVEILHSQRGRTRRGSGENAEYYAKEGKLVLYGGEPTLVDSVRGSTRGQQLTWFINNDRLLVEGGPAQPAISRIQR